MEEEYDLFIEMFDNGEFDWHELDRWTFLNEESVFMEQEGGDGYIGVDNVMKVKDRFFKVCYTLCGKDLDEIYDLDHPFEVFPYEVVVTKYK